MPEREFELYLSLLAQLLKMNPHQRTEISDELRDHLEERFEDLCADGHSREDAIRLALEELGEAAGLAKHFTELSRQRKRRFIMRCTLASGLLLAVAIFGFQAVVPQNPIVEMPADAVAQFGGNAGGFGGGQFGNGGPAGGPVRRINDSMTTRPAELLDDVDLAKFKLDSIAVLDEVRDFDYGEVALSDVLGTMEREMGLRILMDRRLLADQGLSLDDVFVTHTGQATTRQFLNRIIRTSGARELGWFVDRGVIRITTTEAVSDEYLTTRSWDIADLIRAGVGTSQLMSVLQEMTSGQWMDRDGEGGDVMVVGNVLSVRQSPPAHREIADLLTGLAMQVSTTAPKSYRVGNHPATLRIERRLDEKIESLVATETPLAELLGKIAADHGISVLYDSVALDEAGISAPNDLYVTFEVTEQPLIQVLDWMLRSVSDGELTTMVADGALWITTPEAMEEQRNQQAVIYNVRDIATSADDCSTILDAIQSLTSGPWEDIDGEGGQGLVFTTRAIVVRQTDRVHREIEDLLQFHRTHRTNRPADKAAHAASSQELKTVYYQLDKDTAQDLITFIPRFIQPAKWTADPNDKRRGTIELISHGERVTVFGTAIPQAWLVIHQTPAVHGEIDKMMTHLKLSSTDDGGGGGGGGGMGGGGGGGGFFSVPEFARPGQGR